MVNRKWIIVSLVLSLSGFAGTIGAEVNLRIGELVNIKGLRVNQLVGYGLVVGLKGTGDSKRFPLTQELIKNFIKNLGHKDRMAKYESRNSASVLVTAQLPSYANPGEKMDLQVASIGDARSLEGGLLIQTPLYGGDGQIYGVGQGLISTAQDKSSSSARSQKDNVALVTNGCLIERPLLPDFAREKNGKAEIILILKEFSFINAQKINQAIISRYPELESVVLSGSQIRFAAGKENVNTILASVMELKVSIPDMARVVLDERSGVVVMGNQVRVSPVAISVSGLYQKEKKEALEAQDFYESSMGKEKGKALFYIEKTSSIKEVIDKLNEMGASTKDVIAILKAINDSGSLHGELIVR